jgi:hypothetical protein
MFTIIVIATMMATKVLPLVLYIKKKLLFKFTVELYLGNIIVQIYQL